MTGVGREGGMQEEEGRGEGGKEGTGVRGSRRAMQGQIKAHNEREGGGGGLGGGGSEG